ncbi:response regulator transcription factor [Aureimonas jatrophae]|jgi:two-component system, OmpR family, response regulator TctD|uniref:Two-component system, OmpR family, response regulator TctD n=1 Tax=Aureimonas jatrophae TaxID=1166073 RepID=A0A1H0EPA6_9HYPH|nr:response regulator transcription factor [Aureimonas jatrophae]MBB3950395.1 two-component system response regulator TctD [Aureimonas jatrophae]SDN84156.1 two-component system, OmpR family, response regulator TctD [Aureimonas jatrophae]
MRMLLVEDNEGLGEAVNHHLRVSGHSVEWVRTGEDAWEALSLEPFDAVILDLTLPGRDGLSVIAQMRRERVGTPVLVVTARSEIDDKISLLDQGADDYLVKPFDLRELDARLRALLRRQAGQTTSLARFGDLSLDAAGRLVRVGEATVDLGRREFRLLEILLSRPGVVVQKESLMTQLFSFDEPVSTNALELYVSRLRRKLEGSRVEIVTVRGTGYVARVPPAT